ncbi:MAG TPA: hypothetical protein VHT75_04355 [Acidimicrobiales bacterium]|jgi:hypothetical protein|nr:hypothetical protein [Acidimicrobiales bacterium]
MPGPNVVVIPDYLPDMKAWLKTHPTLTPLHGGRVFFRIPTKQGQWPILRIYQLNGGIIGDGGDANVSQIDLSIETVGAPGSFDYTTVRQLAIAVESVMWTMPAGTLLNPGGGPTVALSARAMNKIDSQDPDTGSPRIVLDSRWQIQGL